MLAQCKHHTGVRRNGEERERRHDGKERTESKVGASDSVLQYLDG